MASSIPILPIHAAFSAPPSLSLFLCPFSRQLCLRFLTTLLRSHAATAEICGFSPIHLRLRFYFFCFSVPVSLFLSLSLCSYTFLVYLFAFVSLSLYVFACMCVCISVPLSVPLCLSISISLPLGLYLSPSPLPNFVCTLLHLAERPPLPRSFSVSMALFVTYIARRLVEPMRDVLAGVGHERLDERRAVVRCHKGREVVYPP